MATSPTALAGAATAASDAASVPAPAPVPAKFPVTPLLIAVVLGAAIAALGIGGVVYYMARSGRLSMPHAAAAKVGTAVPEPGRAMALEPLLVNLADAGGNAYLRVSMTLRVSDAGDKKDDKAKEEKAADEKSGDATVAAVRDTALTVLGRQTSDGLLAADGKERLKSELKAAFAEHNRDMKVRDVFFTDFLVQR